LVLLLHCSQSFWIIHAHLEMRLEDQQHDGGPRVSMSAKSVEKKRLRRWRWLAGTAERFAFFQREFNSCRLRNGFPIGMLISQGR
jgi:hypothetical protein